MIIVNNKILISDNNRIFILDKSERTDKCEPCMGSYMKGSSCIEPINEMLGIKSYGCYTYAIEHFPDRLLRISLPIYCKGLFINSYIKCNL